MLIAKGSLVAYASGPEIQNFRVIGLHAGNPAPNVAVETVQRNDGTVAGKSTNTWDFDAVAASVDPATGEVTRLELPGDLFFELEGGSVHFAVNAVITPTTWDPPSIDGIAIPEPGFLAAYVIRGPSVPGTGTGLYADREVTVIHTGYTILSGVNQVNQFVPVGGSGRIEFALSPSASSPASPTPTAAVAPKPPATGTTVIEATKPRGFGTVAYLSAALVSVSVALTGWSFARR